MNRWRLLVIAFVSILSSAAFCQSTVTLSGRVIADDLSPLNSASIFISRFSIGTTSDSLGHFHINLKPGWNEVSFSYIGYNPQVLQLNLTRDTSIEVKLLTNLQLNEVTIIDRKQMINTLHQVNGTLTLTKQNFNSLPAFLGENDPMRAVQMQPGIQSGSEGARGVFIRGGSPDQNLMLLDGATVYNPSHIYGFISVFNGDAIDYVDVHKDNYPSRFGGRLCSVIDIKVSEGDTDKLRGSFSLGLVTSRLHLTGPLGKNKKTSFTLGLRGCYIGLYTAYISQRQYRASGYDGSIYYYFGDVNAKLTHRFSQKTKAELSFFTNNDFYSFKRIFNNENAYYRESGNTEHRIQWANYVAAFALTHEISDQWQMKEHISYSRYLIINKDDDNYTEKLLQSTSDPYFSNASSQNQSYIQDFSWREDATFATPLQTFMMGTGMTGRIFQTGKGEFSRSNSYTPPIVLNLDGSSFKSLEGYVYAEDEYHPSEHWLINAGFHFRAYTIQKRTYLSLLPRVNVLYSPGKQFYLRGSASGLTQNVHLLATASTNILNDYWVPATAKAKPEGGWNFSAGMTQKLPLNFEWSLDGFYRLMNNVIEYKDANESASVYTPWEDQITSKGRGKSYGVEFYAARSKGRITGSVAYTLAWSKRVFTDLNQGRWYPYKYDRRHNLAAQITFLVGKHFELGAAYVYGSGITFSQPLQSYHTYDIVSYYDYLVSNGVKNPSQNDLITIYGGRNNARLPSYQHLDISFTYRKKRKNLEHAFNVSVYNVYNYFNIFSVYSDYRTNEDGTRSIVYKKLSLFPVLPSLSYTIKFSS